MLSYVKTSWNTEMGYTKDYLHDVYNLFHHVNIRLIVLVTPVSASHKHVTAATTYSAVSTINTADIFFQ